jgi:argininosuccinate synthase
VKIGETLERIVLAYSGGLDTSIAIPWLAETFGAEVVTVTLDLGHGSELVEIRQRALALGAVRSHVIDVRDEFIRDYALPALQAGALYADRAPMTTALTRPLIARKLVDVARMEGASAVAHGCAAPHNVTSDDGLRLDALVSTLDPAARLIAPTRMWEISRDEAMAFARERGIPVPASFDGPYKTDANVWGRSTVCSPAQDSWAEVPDEVYALTRSPRDCPDQPAYVEIEFEAGRPIRVNRIEMSPLEMIDSLETIAGLHGVGRIDLMATRLTGGQSREIYEAPAAVVLHAAHNELEQLVIPSDLEQVAHALGRTYADLINSGQWFSPTRTAIDAFVAAIQPRVTGSIRLKLFKGDCRVAGRRSPFAQSDGLPPSQAADVRASRPAAGGTITTHS